MKNNLGIKFYNYNTIKIITILFFTFFALNANAQNDGAQQIIQSSPEIIQRSAFSEVGAKLINFPSARRWASVEIITFMGVSAARGADRRLGMILVASIDCSNRGLEVIKEYINLELEFNKPPKWGILPGNPAYENGFNPENIKHLPVSDVVVARQRRLMEAATDDTMRRNLEPFAPPIEEAAVDFACKVIRDSLSVRQAALQVMENAGGKGLTSLNCHFNYENKNDFNISVRFDEVNNWVQTQGAWQPKRSVKRDYITTMLFEEELLINRLTGRAEILLSRDLTIIGDCQKSSPEQYRF